MRSISNEFAALLAANHTLLMKATLTLADSTVVNLGSEDFMAGSARFEQAVSSDGSFDVGGTIVGTMTVTLANHTGKFDAYDFEGATIVPYVGKQLPNDTYEWLRLGVYDVVKPDSYGGTIGITCSDKLGRLARHALSELNVTYPTYPQTLLSAVASHCGLAVTYRLSPAVNTASVIRPPDSDMSLLDAAGYLAQMMGYWLRCDNMGNIVASWYDFFESDLDGGTFTSDEDSLDGGSLTDYTGELVAGGAFTSSGNEPILIGDAFSTTVKTEDITVTGIQVTESDEVSSSDNNETNGATGRTFIRGTKEYCLAMSQNPFIGYGHGEEVAAGLYTRVGGMRFRPYNDSIPCDPTIEAGDAVVVTDRKGNTYNAYVTGVILKPDGAMETRCSAKAPASNSNVSVSPVSMAFTALKATAERSNQVAAAALEIASAIGQFAWNDNAGTHVSTEEAVAEGTRNILLNSYGILLRAAANYLAALTQSGIAFYDGTGNLADNIVASFGSSGAQIGKDGNKHTVIDSEGFSVYDGQGRLLSIINELGWDRYQPVEPDHEGVTNPGYDPNNPSTYESHIGLYANEVSNIRDKITFGDTSNRYVWNPREGASGGWVPVTSRLVDVEAVANQGSTLSLKAIDSDSQGAIDIHSDNTVDVTGDIYLQGGLNLENNRDYASAVFGKMTDDVYRSLLHIHNDTVQVGYGSYDAQAGATHVWGNGIILSSRDKLLQLEGGNHLNDAEVGSGVLNATYLNTASSSITFYKLNGIVTCSWMLTPNQTSTTRTTVATVPAEFRPMQTIYQPFTTIAANEYALIYNSGEFQMQKMTSGSGRWGAASWVAARDYSQAG